MRIDHETGAIAVPELQLSLSRFTTLAEFTGSAASSRARVLRTQPPVVEYELPRVHVDGFDFHLTLSFHDQELCQVTIANRPSGSGRRLPERPAASSEDRAAEFSAWSAVLGGVPARDHPDWGGCHGQYDSEYDYNYIFFHYLGRQYEVT